MPPPPQPDGISGEVEGRSPGQLFWRRFRQDRFALAGLGFIGVLIGLAVAAPRIANGIVHHGPNDLFIY
jgi:hypothetical protein